MKFIASLITTTILFSTSFTSQASNGFEQVINAQDIGCATDLQYLADSTLKQNPYRIIAYNEAQQNVHLFNALAVSSFRDRDSHVSFHGVKNNDGSCDTSVTESYILQTTCNDARHEAFSKWEQQGKLNAQTIVLTSKRITGKEAFLTSQFGSLCLVTTRQVIRN